LKNIQHIGHWVLFLLLAGCTAQTNDPANQASISASSIAIPGTKTVRSVREGLRLANLAREPNATTYRIRAARIAYEEGDFEQAGRIIESLDERDVSQPAMLDYFLTASQLELHRGNPIAALARLNQHDLNRYAPNIKQQIAIGLTRAFAYQQTGRVIAAARERTLSAPLLNGEEKLDNQEQLFNSLLTLPASMLKDYATKAVDNDLRGWLSLAAMSKQYQNQPSQHLRALSNWKKLWAGHPAAMQLPKRLAFLDSIVAGQPRKIAVLLPQTGPLAAAGQAILKGIISAHFDQGQESELVFYDTTQWNSTIDLIGSATENGADFILGPLAKNRVEELAVARLKVPVLALNRLSETDSFKSKNGNLFFFALAPEDEARQLAIRGVQAGHKNILLIAPNDDWGDRTANAFRGGFSNQGSVNIIEHRFQKDEAYAGFVKRVLAVDNSEKRAQELRKVIGQPFEFKPRRRQDIDMIALLADANKSRQINPALAFYYADNLPIFATSLVHNHREKKINNLDLNGIQFCDMPWKLYPNGALVSRIQKTWPESRGDLGPLFALGLDAFNIIPRLRQLREMPDTQFYGLTGTLVMDQQTLVRQLMWGAFERGEVISTPMVFETI
jgi:outer membrane PBP1 activator LpoA protein